MAVGDDEAKVRAERARAIGLFVQLIREAPIRRFHQGAGKMVRELASREHTDPFGRRVRISRQTIDRWIRDWRAGGFDALVPSPRQCTRAPRPRCWSWRWRCGGEPGAHRRGISGSCAPSWAGRRMNAPCSALHRLGLTGATGGSPRRCSAGSRPSTRTPLDWRCVARHTN